MRLGSSTPHVFSLVCACTCAAAGERRSCGSREVAHPFLLACMFSCQQQGPSAHLLLLQEKAELKRQKEEQEAPYKYATIDGRMEQVGWLSGWRGCSVWACTCKQLQVRHHRRAHGAGAVVR